MNQSFNICRHFVVIMVATKSLNTLYFKDTFSPLPPYHLLLFKPFYKVDYGKGFAGNLNVQSMDLFL